MPFLQIGLTLGANDFTPVAAQGLALLMIKIMFIIAGLLYLIFGVIVTRQVHVMKNTLITSFSSFIQILGYFHLFVSLMVFIFFLLL